MAERADLREEIAAALKGFGSQTLSTAARKLFAALGYESARHIPIGTPAQFCEQLDPGGKLTDRERGELDRASTLRLLFQLTNAELETHADMFADPGAVEATKIESYLFLAAELPAGQYTRTELSAFVRAVNKPLPMPALVLVRHGEGVSLGLIHRRLSRRDQTRDVLEKVTLIKDIAWADPIRAHLEILNDFARANLDADFGVSSFVQLHEAWQRRLGTYALSNNFYREIADWYFWAHHLVEDGAIQLPQHCDTEQEKSLFLIRLLTRVIFCWFLVEKRLIPSELFRESRVKALLKDFTASKSPKHPDKAPTYYHAILQNLFFGTLNMPPEQRGFREKKKPGERYDKNYGVTNLWRYETDFHDAEEWVEIAKRIPFLNGGLFDCLDDKTGTRKDNFILDGFSDNARLACQLPNDLFFGPERTVDLSSDYGEEDKRAARSKKASVRGLVEILSRYKFTIEENTPLEEEIALDPELLGKVFENLLASYNEDTRTTARKALGAFYTPREIVSYMVDEALKSYLATQVPRCKGLLDLLFSNKPEGLRERLEETAPGTKDALIAAIGRVKILDPACGSGAFPMGALHRLVDLLQKLDPNSESWKRDRLAEAQAYCSLLRQADAPKEEIADCNARIADIEKSFDTRFHALDFARKLYLIENCIYGVDIQPIATQIAKLRFFISLVVDQKVDPASANLGVRPLPNLETRLVAADTLIPIEKSESDLFSNDLDRLRAELADIRHQHFNARTPAAKRTWREADGAKRAEIAQTLEESHALSKEAARKLAAWDPYDQNTHAPFFDVDWMFGKTQAETISSADTSQAGFDIVIGNPPYIRIQTLKQKDPKLVVFLKNHYASAGKGNYDIYVVFVEAGLNLLKPDGHLAYICPHKFFNSEYGEPLRSLISRGRHLQHVVHFGDEQVFPGALIYTCLLFLAKSGSPDCLYVDAQNLPAWITQLTGTSGRFTAASVSESEWNFAVGSSGAVFRRLMQYPQKLGDVALRIYQGPITSADPIYLFKDCKGVNGTSRTVEVFSKELNETVALERGMLKRVVRSGEIGKHWANPTALVLFPYEVQGTDARLLDAKELKKHWPLVWHYLERNRSVLRSREKGAFDDGTWYRFGRTQNLGMWEQPKVMVPYMVTELSAFLDRSQHLYFINVTTGGYGITTNEARCRLPTLCALLNSTVLDFCLKRISSNFQGGYFPANKQFIEQLPIAPVNTRQGMVLESLSELISSVRANLKEQPATQVTRNPLLPYLEQVLNGLVYELYFPEELHAVGVRFFDLIAAVGALDSAELPMAARLSWLSAKVEELQSNTHPLKSAIQKLQTIDTIRIIEGEK